jgi:hypothetical protein
MNEHTQTASEWKRDEAMKGNFAVVTGYVLSALTVAILLADAGVTLFIPTQFQAEMNAAGFPMTLAPSLGVIEVLVAILYAAPRTAVLGAILIAGFSGGAICAHFRLGEMGSPPELVSAAIGIIAWAGLWFRDARLRELLPLVSGKAA